MEIKEVVINVFGRDKKIIQKELQENKGREMRK